MKRREFLKSAMQAVAAAPLLSAAAESPKHPSRAAAAKQPTLVLNVREFGAKGDGTTPDTAALQQALDRCGVLGGGTVVVPAGNYLTGSLSLRSKTTLRLEQDAVLSGSPKMDDYAVTQVRWEGKWIAGHIGLLHAIDAEDVTIVGPGKIAGNPALGGRPTKEQPRRHPALIEFINCRRIHLEGFSTSYERMWSIHPSNSDEIVIRNLTIRSTGGNGDGIDVDSCRQVLIEGCDIATGDDCISLKSGRGAEAYALLRTTEDVTIHNCTFADSIFACIGIGSETSGGIRNVLIEHCKFTGAHTHAFYIKSRPGRGAFVEEITARDLDISNTRLGFLRINQLSSGIQDQNPVPGAEGIPLFRNFRFSKIRVSDVPQLVQATEIHPDKPLDGLVLEEITGTCAKGIELANARRVVLRGINVTGYSGPLVSTWNVSGEGVAKAAKLDEPKRPEPVVVTEPYTLH